MPRTFSPAMAAACLAQQAARSGIETWVCRHEDRLRREVAVSNGRRPRHCGVG
jgi:hypothetical protein